jgi:hypothetical protein
LLKNGILKQGFTDFARVEKKGGVSLSQIGGRFFILNVQMEY